MAKSAKSSNKFPPQIKYIVGNEACERFSFYGMRTILVVFMIQYLGFLNKDAKSTYHLFVGACYLLPLLGAFLSDRFWGKYKTILWISLFYCFGHAALAIWENKFGLYLGLALIAFGSGGIKPCISAHVGDQFNESNKHLLEKVYSIFYFSVNFGAFFSSLLTPFLLVKFGPRIAFGVPGILMAIATAVFWMGRKFYIIVPPTRDTGTAGFGPIFLYSLLNFNKRKRDQDFFDIARAKFKAGEVEGAKAAASIFKVFITITFFWALYDQTGSSWVLQAEKMNLFVWGYKVEASQVQAVNAILVLILIPIFSLWIYPWMQKIGLRPTPLRKMGMGLILTTLSFVAVGIIQVFIDRGATPSVLWQIVPYIILTAGEVMVSITGLEFAYTQAPRSMKSTIMSFWLLTVFAGNMVTAYISQLNVFTGSMEFFFYAALMFVVTFIFMYLASRYRERNFIETKATAEVAMA